MLLVCLTNSAEISLKEPWHRTLKIKNFVEDIKTWFWMQVCGQMYIISLLCKCYSKGKRQYSEGK